MGGGPQPPTQGASPALTPSTYDCVMASDPPTVKISPLYDALLHSADGLSNRVHQHSVAVLVAQTAIEVCTQRLITKLLDQRGATFLEKWIDDRLQNYNIRTETVRKLYEAVSSDAQLVNQPFWTSNRLIDHIELRNDVAHQGRVATPAQAQASLDVAREVITYLTGIATQHSIDLSN